MLMRYRPAVKIIHCGSPDALSLLRDIAVSPGRDGRHSAWHILPASRPNMSLRRKRQTKPDKEAVKSRCGAVV